MEFRDFQGLLVKGPTELWPYFTERQTEVGSDFVRWRGEINRRHAVVDFQ